MSYAINRQEIIEIVFDGQGTPAQQAPNNDGPLYIEGMDTQYIEYDVAKAQEYLDKVFTKGKDADGFYLNDKGKRFEMIFTVQNDLSYGTTYVQVAELLIGYWEKVGVKATLNSIASDPYEVARKDNTIECIIFTGEGGAGITPILDPRYYVPLYGYQGYFDRAWYAWRVNETPGCCSGRTAPMGERCLCQVRRGSSPADCRTADREDEDCPPRGQRTLLRDWYLSTRTHVLPLQFSLGWYARDLVRWLG